MASSINASTAGSGGVITTADNSGVLNLQTAGTTAVTIDTSQNFYVNKSTYSDTAGNGFGVFPNSGVPQVSCVGASNSTNKNFTVYSATDSAYKFYTDYAGNGYFAGNLQFNSGYGSAATAYGCRAWANFNGSNGASPVIRASGNISSITRNSTGKYTVSFATALPDANYTVTSCSSRNYNNFLQIGDGVEAPTTTTLILYSANGSNTLADCLYGLFAVFR